MGSMKENSIREYISNIDFSKDNWSVNRIEEDMKIFLGETPGIDISYKKDVVINEILGEAKEIQKIEKVSIIFTDLNDKFKKIEFLIDK